MEMGVIIYGTGSDGGVISPLSINVLSSFSRCSMLPFLLFGMIPLELEGLLRFDFLHRGLEHWAVGDPFGPPVLGLAL